MREGHRLWQLHSGVEVIHRCNSLRLVDEF